MEKVSRISSKLSAGASSVISKSLEEGFRTTTCFLVGVFLNLIIVAFVRTSVQVTMIVTILFLIPVLEEGFIKEWKKVAAGVYKNVYENLKKVYDQLYTKIYNYIYSYVKEIAKKFMKSIPSKFANFLSGIFSRNDGGNAAPEQSNYQMARALHSACIMGVIVGRVAHLTIQLVLHLLYTRVVSMFFQFVLAVIQFPVEESYIAIIIYCACVGLLSVAAVVVYVSKYQKGSAPPVEEPTSG